MARRVGLASAFLLGVVHGAGAQRSPEELRRLESDSESVRIETFYHLLYPQPGGSGARGYRASVEGLALRARQDNGLAISLIALLEREQAQLTDVPGSKTEEFSNYYGNLINAVSQLHDARATKGLIHALPTGKMASDGLLNIGEAAVPSLLLALRSPNVGMRQSAARTVGELAARRADSLSPNSNTSIRAALLAALSDEDGTVRLCIVRALDVFVDREVYEALQEVAEKDPFTIGPPERRIYIVRETAKSWIRTNGPRIGTEKQIKRDSAPSDRSLSASLPIERGVRRR